MAMSTLSLVMNEPLDLSLAVVVQGQNMDGRGCINCAMALAFNTYGKNGEAWCMGPFILFLQLLVSLRLFQNKKLKMKLNE